LQGIKTMNFVKNKVILELTSKLGNYFGPRANKELPIDFKEDQSLVTEIDQFVSNILKRELAAHPNYSTYQYFSEEDFDELLFPCAVVDPIDGTRELAKGRPECAVSLALMHSPHLADPLNYAWLFNPFSGFDLDSNTPFVSSMNKSSQKLLCLVSRSELHKGYFNRMMNQDLFDISPRGSIAFKLGLLASGGCDLVVSLAPKNIWDIAAGTQLCSQRGIHFYINGEKVTSLDEAKYQGFLMWACDEVAQKVNERFKDEIKKLNEKN
jgi:myo-inositol-1(or 4)-monophosphatase